MQSDKFLTRRLIDLNSEPYTAEKIKLISGVIQAL